MRGELKKTKKRIENKTLRQRSLLLQYATDEEERKHISAKEKELAVQNTRTQNHADERKKLWLGEHTITQLS